MDFISDCSGAFCREPCSSQTFSCGTATSKLSATDEQPFAELVSVPQGRAATQRRLSVCNSGPTSLMQLVSQRLGIRPIWACTESQQMASIYTNYECVISDKSLAVRSVIVLTTDRPRLLPSNTQLRPLNSMAQQKLPSKLPYLETWVTAPVSEVDATDSYSHDEGENEVGGESEGQSSQVDTASSRSDWSESDAFLPQEERSVSPEAVAVEERELIVDRLMDSINAWLEARLEDFIRRRGDGTSSHASSGSNIPSSTSQVTQSSKNKRHRSAPDKESNENEGEDDENGNLKRPRRTAENSDPSLPNLACPFFQHDPSSYRSVQWRSCGWPGFPNVHRLK